MNKFQQWAARNLLGLNTKALGRTPVIHTNLPVSWINGNAEQYIEEGYGANDIVYSILTMAADKERMAPWDVYKIKDESSLKLYEAEIQKKDVDLKKALNLRTKALEKYDGDGKLNELLDWPNENETFSDLVANSGIVKRLTGNRYIKSTLLDIGMHRGKPQELHLLPSQNVAIKSTRTFPARALGYQLNLGQIIDFSKEEILHDKLFNPLYKVIGEELYGMSPIQAAIKNLTRNKSAKTAAVKSFDNLGPDTLIYTDDERMSADQAIAQARAVKEVIMNEYSGAENRKKMAVSGFKMGAVNLGLSPVDLQLLEAEKWDVVMFANVYNFPHILLIPEHSTLDNLKIAERSLTSRCCLPYLTSFRNNFNRKLRTDWGYKGSNIYVDFDLSVYTEMQQDMKSLTEWVMASWHLTPRQRYELQQLDIPEEIEDMPELDMIFVPSGFTEISGLNPENIQKEMDRIEEQENQNSKL
jgi:HK97 family phage portal protein